MTTRFSIDIFNNDDHEYFSEYVRNNVEVYVDATIARSGKVCLSNRIIKQIAEHASNKMILPMEKISIYITNGYIMLEFFDIVKIPKTMLSVQNVINLIKFNSQYATDDMKLQILKMPYFDGLDLSSLTFNIDQPVSQIKTINDKLRSQNRP